MSLDPGLNRYFKILADGPRLGRAAEIIAPDLRRHKHESRVILYAEAQDRVLVLAFAMAAAILS